MKKLLSFKIFGWSHYLHTMTPFLAALVFATLFVFSWQGQNSYKEKLSSYSRSYLTLTEISPDLVQGKLSNLNKSMKWNELYKAENNFFEKANKINNNKNVAWKKFKALHIKLSNEVKKLKRLNIDELKSKTFNKVDSLNSFVEKKNWRRLTRITNRAKALVDSKNLSMSNIEKIAQELNRARIVTEKSLLSDYEKSAVLSRLNRISEVDDMLNLNKAQKKTSTILDLYFKQYLTWYNGRTASFADKRSDFLNQDFFQSIFMGACLFFLLLGSLSWVLKARTTTTRQSKIEDEFEKILEFIVFDKGENRLNHFSESFTKTIARTKKHLSRRMHFGQVIEQGLPFSGMLIDSDLQVTWMNELAQKKLGINFNLQESNYLNWDHIKQFTTFTDFDPISDAIAHQNGGVFDTELRLGNDDTDRAEFFVSPVEMEGKRYVFVCFQLQSYYQSVMENNKTSLIEPFHKTFQYLEQTAAENTDMESAQAFFDSTETAELYPIIAKVLNRYIESIVELKEALNIEETEGQLKTQEIHALVDAQKIHLQTMIDQTKNFTSLRTNIVTLDKEIITLFDQMETFENDLKSHLIQSHAQQNKFYQMAEGIEDVSLSISGFKKLLHEKKSALDNVKGHKIELKQMLSRVLAQTESNTVIMKLEELDQSIEKTEHFNKELDVYLGRLEYYFEELAKTDNKLDYHLEGFKNIAETRMSSIHACESGFGSVMEQFAVNLETQFSILKKYKKTVQDQAKSSSSLTKSSDISVS